MWKQRETPDETPEPQDGEGWLVNEQQELVCEFSADEPSSLGLWVTIRTFRWRKPDYPIPQARRRMLRDSAIIEWKTMQAAGWRRCSPPVRWNRICEIRRGPVRFYIRQRILDRRVHCARTDKFWFHEQNRPHSSKGVETGCISFQRISTHRLRIPPAAPVFAWISRRRTLQRVILLRIILPNSCYSN